MKKYKTERVALRLTKSEKEKLDLIDTSISDAIRKCIEAYEVKDVAIDRSK